ncbi:MAG: GGDEF domain-containing protein [Halieaceae bacterium]|nr:GGDEF domain-containing protein [Halieaceae bacterium]
MIDCSLAAVYRLVSFYLLLSFGTLLLGGSAQAMAQAENSSNQAPATTGPKSAETDKLAEVNVLLARADLDIQKSQYEQALKSLTSAYQITGTMEDASVGRNVLNSMANVYYNIGQYEPAERYYRELVSLDEADNNLLSLSVSLFNLGHVNASQKQFQVAETNFNRSLALSRKLADSDGAAHSLKALGVNAHAQDELEGAGNYLEQALQAFQKNQNHNEAAVVHRHLGDVEEARGNLRAAVRHYEEALPVLTQHASSLSLQRTYRGLSGVYEQLHDYKNALISYRTYALLLNQEQQQKSLETTQRMLAEFETERFSDDNERLEMQNQRQKLELKHRSDLLQMQYLAIFLSVGIIILVATMWWRSRNHAQLMLEHATTDELTGLSNRRAILRFGSNEWERSERFNRPFTCLIFDIDHFKSINDTWGHAAGDQVLKILSATLLTTLRTTDALGRFGGEEFLLFATETEPYQAGVLAERIRQKVEATVYMDIPELKVTVSIGIAQKKSESSLDQLIHHADQALYAAKEGGRNQIIVYGED